jgi:FKBP-type peptidyl-prolyl cis-trans isomerase SlyD
MTHIEKDSVVSISYTIHDLSGELLDENKEGLEYLHGGYDNIFPLVEEALHEKQVGDKLDLSLEPQDAFGEQEEDLIRIESEQDFGIDDLAVGMVLEADDPETGETQLFRVIEIQDGKVVLDGNHPFAGLGVRFQCEVMSIRKATPEEINHGHVHGEHDGHH